MQRLLPLAAVACFVLMACSPTGGTPGVGKGRYRNQDANGDGKVTLEEAKAAQKGTFDRFDNNHDGSLSFEEIEAMPERLASRMYRIDTDSDREVSAAEIAQSAEARFRRRDKNGDGVLSGDELRFGRQRDSTGGPVSSPL